MKSVGGVSNTTSGPRLAPKEERKHISENLYCLLNESGFCFLFCFLLAEVIQIRQLRKLKVMQHEQ